MLVCSRRGHARLADEAPAEALVLGQLGGEQLERHLPAQPEVLGPVDDGHPAAAEQLLDAVRKFLTTPIRRARRTAHGRSR